MQEMEPTLSNAEMELASIESDDMSGSPRQPSRSRKRLSAEKWESVRPIITKLYQEEKRPLKEVMTILREDHSFEATVKMFKSRIWKWGLDKKLKSDEVLAILILKHQRDLANKPTEFRIRGQPVHLDNIYRYLRRNPGLMARFQSGARPNQQTMLEVQCRTPSPEPTIFFPYYKSETQDAERVLSLFRNYISGKFDSGSWQFQYDVSCTGKVGDRSIDLFERVIASFALVNRCMARSEKINLGNLLGPSFETLKEIVASESPVFVVRTACLLWYLDRHHKHDLLRLVLDYLNDLVPIYLGPNHALTQVWHLLSTTQFSDYYDLSLRLYLMLIPELERRIGPANHLTHILYSDYTDCLFEGDRAVECESVMRRHLTMAQATGWRHPWLSSLAFDHNAVRVAILESQGRTKEALAHLENYLDNGDLDEEQEASIILEIGVHQHRLGEVPMALQSFKETARRAILLDLDERILLTSLANLEKMLMELGNAGEAHAVFEYRMEHLATFAETSARMSQGSTDRYDSEDESIQEVELPLWLRETDECGASWVALFGAPPLQAAPQLYPGSCDFSQGPSPMPGDGMTREFIPSQSPDWLSVSSEVDEKVSPLPWFCPQAVS